MRHLEIATTDGRPACTGPLNILKKTYRHRVAVATAIAQTSPVRHAAEHYTTKVGNPTAIVVDCYAGYRGEETPRRFTREDQLVEVVGVID